MTTYSLPVPIVINKEGSLARVLVVQNIDTQAGPSAGCHVKGRDGRRPSGYTVIRDITRLATMIRDIARLAAISC